MYLSTQLEGVCRRGAPYRLGIIRRGGIDTCFTKGGGGKHVSQCRGCGGQHCINVDMCRKMTSWDDLSATPVRPQCDLIVEALMRPAAEQKRHSTPQRVGYQMNNLDRSMRG